MSALPAAASARIFNYLLSMVEIRVPRLADRKEDLPYLERYCPDKFAREFGKVIRGIAPHAQIVLARYSWPGNVRELANTIDLSGGQIRDRRPAPQQQILTRDRGQQRAERDVTLEC